MNDPQRQSGEAGSLNRVSSIRMSAGRSAAPAVSLRSLGELAKVFDTYSASALLENHSAAQTALRFAARGVVNDVRAEDALRGERVIVVLREWWNAQRMIRRFGDDLVCDALWSKLIGICIREFYTQNGRD
jgi:hypothetical protein